MMEFDLFISYSSKDKPTADATCAALESAGLRCWMAPRDILPGSEYGGAIIDALDHCRAVVLVFSASANASPQIHREIERAVNRAVPIVPLRIEDTVPTESMAYFMESVHWLDAMSPPLDDHLRRLSESLKALLKNESVAAASASPLGESGHPPPLPTRAVSGASAGDRADGQTATAENRSIVAAEEQRRADKEERLRLRGSGARSWWTPARAVMAAGFVLGVLLLGAIGAWLAESRTVPAPAIIAPAPATTAPAPATTAPAPVTHLGQLRFDGTYRTDAIGNIYSHLRFYPDGRVIYFWQRVNEANPTPTSFPESGITSSYQISGMEIKMSLPRAKGAEDFDGTIVDAGLKIHWFNHVNGASGDQQYQFIPFSP